MYEYLVLTERDARFSGTYDRDELQATLNRHADDGWRLVEALVAANPLKTAKAEIVMILERPRTTDDGANSIRGRD